MKLREAKLRDNVGYKPTRSSYAVCGVVTGATATKIGGWLEILHFKAFSGKIEIPTTLNLLCGKFAAVRRKMQLPDSQIF